MNRKSGWERSLQVWFMLTYTENIPEDLWNIKCYKNLKKVPAEVYSIKWRRSGYEHYLYFFLIVSQNWKPWDIFLLLLDILLLSSVRSCREICLIHTLEGLAFGLICQSYTLMNKYILESLSRATMNWSKILRTFFPVFHISLPPKFKVIWLFCFQTLLLVRNSLFYMHNKKIMGRYNYLALGDTAWVLFSTFAWLSLFDITGIISIY